MRCCLAGILAGLLAVLTMLGGCGSVDMEAYTREYQLGLEYLSRGEYEEAVLTFSAAIEIDPRSDAYLGRADAYFALGQYGEAVSDYEAVGDGLTAQGYLQWSDAYMALGDVSRAAGVLEQGFAFLGDGGLEARLTELTSVGPLLEELGQRLEGDDLESVMELMAREDFQDLWEGIAGDDLYFGPLNDRGEREGTGLAVYPNGSCYFGGWAGGQRSGQGILLHAPWFEDSEGDYYLYEGSWSGDLPNGPGREEDMQEGNLDTVEGFYRDGMHHGTMHVVFQIGDEVHHWSPITAVDGYWLVDPSLELDDCVAYSLDEENHYLGDDGFHVVPFLMGPAGEGA